MLHGELYTFLKTQGFQTVWVGEHITKRFCLHGKVSTDPQGSTALLGIKKKKSLGFIIFSI